MKKGCLLFIVLGLLGIGLIGFIGSKAKDLATESSSNNDNGTSKGVVKKDTPKKDDEVPRRERPKFKEGHSAGYLVGKTAASEGKPERDADGLFRQGRILGDKDEDFASGFFYGWREGYRQRKEYMKATGELPKKYVPSEEW